MDTPTSPAADKPTRGRPKKTNLWSTQRGEYSPANFYVAASDSKGHDQFVRMRVPPNIAGEVASLVASRKLPVYKTASDFYRDAVIHRLRYLLDNNMIAAQIRDSMTEAIAALELERMLNESLGFHSTVARIQATIEQHKDSIASTPKLLKKLRDAADKLPNPYRRQVLGQLRKLESAQEEPS